MAMNWLKMRDDLHEDPAVLWMAQELDVRPETVVGMCHRFWGLVSRQTGDGCLTGPSLSSLGSVLGLPGFPELLEKAGWLEHDASGEKPVTRIPKFERHLSEGAKSRALASEKKRLQRMKMSPKTRDNCPNKTGTREEKRREEKRKSKELPPTPKTTKKTINKTDDFSTIEFPKNLDSEECRDALEKWVEYKKARGKPYKCSTSVSILLKRWAKRGGARFIDAVEHSIASEYQGLYEEAQNGKQSNRSGQTERRTAAYLFDEGNNGEF